LVFVFEFKIGESSINTGFDNTIKEMKIGEKRIVILPVLIAYGRNGYYSNEKNGRKGL
jgi:FKBP-type peptidyl-prolyl cis-trans isomerase